MTSAIRNPKSAISHDFRNPQSEIRNSRWWVVTLTVHRDVEEDASAQLFELGTTGIITLEETDATAKLGAYFGGPETGDELRRLVEAAFERAGLSVALRDCSVSSVPEQDWMQKWKEGFEPVEIGDRLIVAPSWKLPGKTEARTVIQIDPGMAFGTGTHETTRLCLEAIERYWHGGSLLDVGTGTGILAIAAALLAPAARVVAIDIDPQAVEVARENVAINGASSSIELLAGQPRNLAGHTFDVVVANLTAEVVIALMDDLAGCLAPDGLMILSGILTEFAEDVDRALATAGFSMIERRDAGEWCALIARRA